MKENETFMVYENWRAEKKAVVHKSTCGHVRTGHDRLNDDTAPNDKWYGYFDSEEKAIEFALSLPDRDLRLCKRCITLSKENYKFYS